MAYFVKRSLFATIALLVVMSKLVFASSICDVRDFGAVGDGKTKDTLAIQAAVEECSKNNGTVLLKNGEFLSGTIFLRSHMRFIVDISATLKGSQKDSDYPDLHPATTNTQLKDLRKSLIHADGVEGLTIGGRGIINGRGDKLAWIIPWITESKRPMAIFVARSKNVIIENLRVRDAAMWGVVTLETDDLIIRGLDIHSPYLPNRDGIDVVDGHNILIENNTVYSQDDSICLKSGSKHGTENVIVRNNTILASTFANGLKLGTSSVGSFRNILFEDNFISNVNLAAMTVESIDGAAVENVVFRNIRVRKTGTPFFVLLGLRKSSAESGLKVGSIDGVRFEDIQVDKTTADWGSAISGSVIDGVLHPVRNVTFNNVRADFKSSRHLSRQPKEPKEYKGQYPDPHMWGKLPAVGIYFRHIEGGRIDSSVLTSNGKDVRPMIFGLKD